MRTMLRSHNLTDDGTSDGDSCHRQNTSNEATPPYNTSYLREICARPDNKGNSLLSSLPRDRNMNVEEDNLLKAALLTQNKSDDNVMIVPASKDKRCNFRKKYCSEPTLFSVPPLQDEIGSSPSSNESSYMVPERKWANMGIEEKLLYRPKHLPSVSHGSDHCEISAIRDDTWDSALNDVIRKTVGMVIGDSSGQSGSSGHDTFSISPLATLKTPRSAGTGYFSSPVFHYSGTSRKPPAEFLRWRQRRYGSSSVVDGMRVKTSKIAKPYKTSPKFQLMKKFKKNCKILSTSVTPCIPSALLAHSNVFRVSGISMSPSTPISWKTQSPLELDSVTTFSSLLSKGSPHSTPGHFYRRRSASDVSSPSKLLKTNLQRLRLSDDSCPPDKFYYWDDDFAELVTDEKLGRGSFGQVFEGTFRGQKVAIKKLKTGFERQKAADFENFVGEIMSLRLSHPNLVRSLVLVQPPNSPLTPSSKNTNYLVMEHAGECNLLQVINNAVDIPLETQIRYNLDILQGLSYLHNHGIAHLDLKPGNVIVTSDDLCKICDFGSCKLVEMNSLTDEAFAFSSVNQSNSSLASSNGDRTSSGPSTSGPKNSTPSLLLGTYLYRAPELLQGLDPTLKADIFSFAVTSWQIKNRSDPYPHLHPHAAIYLIVTEQRRPGIPCNVTMDGMDNIYYGIVERCWSHDPTERPAAYEALDEFFDMKASLCCL